MMTPDNESGGLSGWVNSFLHPTDNYVTSPTTRRDYHDQQGRGGFEAMSSGIIRRSTTKGGRGPRVRIIRGVQQDPAMTRPASSFLYCPTCAGEVKLDKPADEPLPDCLAKGESCMGAQRKEAVKYIEGVHETLGSAVYDAAAARARFERKACDYKIAESKGLQELMHTYGYAGPRKPGGSYVWYLLQYKKLVDVLQKSCQMDHSCAELVNKMQNFPSLRPGGSAQLPIRFHVWGELQKACDLNEKHTPVPSEVSAWCNGKGDKCEVRNCRTWWESVHSLRSSSGGRGWSDDGHPGIYKLFKSACRFLRRAPASAKPLSEQWGQAHQIRHAEAQRVGSLCGPQRLLGFCEDPSAAGSTAAQKCIMPGGSYCNRGRTLGGVGVDWGLYK
ncbi:unnamed protein product [Amoebophrya sp. A25]|nr:unnamed protein product [Amoebophrya sp. A25]|eukprot:GSA25T00022522001.1